MATTDDQDSQHQRVGSSADPTVSPLRCALSRASEALDAAGDAQYVNLRTQDLYLLVLYAKTMLPVPSTAGNDFNAWQDVIDAATQDKAA